jgi:hypothetical protein
MVQNGLGNGESAAIAVITSAASFSDLQSKEEHKRLEDAISDVTEAMRHPRLNKNSEVITLEAHFWQ